VAGKLGNGRGLNLWLVRRGEARGDREDVRGGGGGGALRRPLVGLPMQVLETTLSTEDSA
jgi:hypothetical protein